MGTSVGEDPEPTRRENAEGPGSARGRGLGTAAEGSGSAEDRGLGSAQERPGSAHSPGLKGLTTLHRDAYASGALSQVDIARELGVSKQAIQKAFRQRDWSTSRASGDQRPSLPVPASASTSPEPSQPAATPLERSVKAAPPADDDTAADWLPESQRDQYRTLVARRTLKAVVQILEEAVNGLDKDAGKLGPAALAGYARTVRSTFELGAFLLHRPEELSGLAELKIATMTDEEVQATRTAANRAFASSFDGDDEEDAVDLRSQTAPETTPSSSAMPTPASTIDASMPLPDRANLRPWLMSLVESHGRRHLRSLAEQVGLQPTLQDTNEFLADAIIHKIDGEPQRLRPPRS